MRTTSISTIVPALAALAFGPLLGAAEGEQPVKDQRQEMSSLNEESIRTLDKTGRLLIVDLGDEPMNGDRRIHFKQAWEDRSLEGDVPESVRYVVISDPKGSTPERETVRDAFEENGFYQITWFYVDDPTVIDRARQGDPDQDPAAAEGASNGRAERRQDAPEQGAEGDVSGAALREGEADARQSGAADQPRGAKGERQGKANGAKASDGDDQDVVSPTSPKTPDRPKAAE